MNTTLVSSLIAEVPGYVKLQREMHDPRSARPEGSQFPITGWIAQLVHTVCSVVAPRRGRPGCPESVRGLGDALIAQRPEWILPNGNCPTCDSYDARLAELLVISLATERAVAQRPNNLTNTTQLPTFFVNHGGRPSLAHDLTDPRNFVIPAGYARQEDSLPQMASAIQYSSHEKPVQKEPMT
jgi:hypothetical protein